MNSIFRPPLKPQTKSFLLRVVNVRTFSATACAPKATGPLPTFKPTSNSDLDTILTTIRDELFIPTHLLKRHRNLTMRKKNHFILEEEPLHVEISGQNIPLRPKDREIPVPKKLFTKALNFMKDPSDLDAIPGLLSGYAQADRHLREDQIEKMTRTIIMSGRIDLLMEIARGAGENGFKFTKPVAREFMRGLKVQNALQTKEAAVKGVRFGERLLDIFGQPTAKTIPTEQLKKDPVILGTLLSMVASTSKRFNEGKDYKSLTRKYTDRLRNCWEDVEWELNLVHSDTQSIFRAKTAVLDYMPVLDGLVQARDILAATNYIPWLETESARLNEALGTWKAFVESHIGDKKVYGMHSYREVSERLAKEVAEREEKEKVVPVEKEAETS